MNDQDRFLALKRLSHEPSTYFLSAGLSPRVFLSASSPGDPWDLVTSTRTGYLMGGTYFWARAGTIEREETGSRIPFFKKGKKIGIDCPYPVQGHLEQSIHFSPVSFFIMERARGIDFVENEALSMKFGSSLLDSGINMASACKIEIRDVNGDGLPDIVVGENDWSEYHPRWNDKATHWGDKDYRPFDDAGAWRGGRLNGRVKVSINLGEDAVDPTMFKFTPPEAIDGVNQYGFCTPVFGDFSDRGQEDMICGDFLNNLTYFKRIDQDPGTFPRFEAGVPVLDSTSNPRKMHGVINYFIGADIAGHGRVDLLVGSENGYVTLLENLGEQSSNGAPMFAADYILQQEEAPLKADVLAVPAVGPLRNGHLDMVIGTAAGLFYRVNDVLTPSIDGIIVEIPRIVPPDPAKGSIQGPSEIAWGYVTPVLFDWNGDGLLDIVFSDINGEHQVSLNEGTADQPRFTLPKKLLDSQTGEPLNTAWRARPALHRRPSGVIDYYCLDEDSYLCRYETASENILEKKERVECTNGGNLRFTSLHGGSAGRDRFQLFDWDGTGTLDILVSLPRTHDFSLIAGCEHATTCGGATVALLKNRGTDDHLVLGPPAYLIHEELNAPLNFGHHECAAEAFRSGDQTYLLVGGEDGQLYLFKREEFE
jgi:hypothetical protein